MAHKRIRGLYQIPFIILLSLPFLIFVNGLQWQSSFEDLDVDRQLQILNKPYVKSVQTGEGDVFDCVNILEQPSFNSPLLKNHKIQTKPSSFPKGFLRRADHVDAWPSAKSFKIGCPSGTVPIKRTRREDLIKAKMLVQTHMANIARPMARGSPGFHNAIRLLPSDPSRKYLGAGAKINIQNPSVSNTQFSQAFVRILSGSANQVDSIQVGWMVNPALSHDNFTRFFSLWTANKKGCFDLHCPGFVQVSKDFPLGSVFKDVSVYGGKQFDFNCLVFKDKGTGNWWLLLGDNYDQSIGYWPSSLFTALSSSATEVAWGGAVFGSSNEASPPMGSGHFAKEGMTKAAYVKELQIMDESSYEGPPNPNLLKYITDNANCYTIGPIEGYVHGFLYGGPGGSC